MTTKPPPGEPADQELIFGINAGDDAAFERLYHRHREWVFRMACRICGSEHHAQDVVQEVFRYFLGKFPGFELRTFLLRCVGNGEAAVEVVGCIQSAVRVTQLRSRSP